MSQRKSSKSSKSKSSNLLRSIGAIIGAILVLIAGLLTQGGGNTPSATNNSVTNTRRPTVVNNSSTQVASVSGSVREISVGQGFGYRRDFWQVYFTAPTGSSRSRDYNGGINENLATAIGEVRSTLDIAAFEFNSPFITQAVLDAEARGVRVRMVTDTQSGLNDEDTTISQLIAAGIPVVDDVRTALMHDKFMIMDSQVVWTGSWNYTINDTYRNNNSAIVLRSQQAVQLYQAEFDEMFTSRSFGPRSPANNVGTFTQDGVVISIYFAPENDVDTVVAQTVATAQRSIRFLAFSFTLDNVAAAMQERFGEGVIIQGIFETSGSEQPASELRPLLCAGMDMRQDGNPYFLHHKVIIIDNNTVLVGSFNFSASATDSNDENLIIIQDADIAALYIQEFERRWAEAVLPANIQCG